MDYTIFVVFALFLGGNIGLIVVYFMDRERRKRHKHHFHLRVLFNTKNKYTMSLNAVVLNDFNPHTGAIVMSDNFGNQYTGTLANATVTGFTPADDDVHIDPANPDNLVVEAHTENATTTVTLTGDWTSAGNTTSRPNPNPAKPGSEVIADGTVKTGLTCQVSITNAVARAFGLAVNF